MTFADLLPNFIRIPAAPFSMGTPERELSALAKAYGGTRESYREESPQFKMELPAFALAQTPVTNGLYAAYAAASGARAPITWRGPQPPDALRDHPVVDVSWEEANAFCVWLRTQNAECRVQSAEDSPNHSLFSILHSPFRLPTEAEWEQAARGSDGRASRGAMSGTTGGPTRARAGWAAQRRSAATPTARALLAAWIWRAMSGEWTSSLDALYPYSAADGREDPRAPGRRILRGGCYANPHGFARCACRFRLLPTVRNPFLGFRLACSIATDTADRR